MTLHEWQICTDPAQMLAALPLDERRLRAFGISVWREWHGKLSTHNQWVEQSHKDALWWIDNPTEPPRNSANIEWNLYTQNAFDFANAASKSAMPNASTLARLNRKGVRPERQCDLLRCLFADPTRPLEMRECPECDGKKVRTVSREFSHDEETCPHCKGSGRIPVPRIDGRWLSSAVCDLVKLAAGAVCPKCKDGEAQEFEFDPHKWLIVYADYEMSRHPCYECDGVGHLPPDYSRLEILADALMDAGCQDAELMEHLRQPVHVQPANGRHECWAIRELMEAMG